ncbi:MAG: hypothetical protein BTN85_1925 [Candidatus Methanohalarchaeum thermophilum]|uniref:Uncharacterized protein n=1 Tax=Methanohalarchaeum thermophilum TaxID=1903181 RepID=A0A1Q6DSH7_METT1|nr:MAG: hypothetical protein BTN85_1925 [Candidatus Methanohalarchaeum thermophilum]
MDLPTPSDEEKIIAIIGSTRFKETWKQVFKKLLEKGWFPRGVECYGHADKLDEVENYHNGYKDYLEKLHKKRIKEADSVLVLNKDSYIGESTENELKLARKLDKNIYWLE